MKKTRRIWMVLLVVGVFVAMAACAGMTPAGQKILRARGTVESCEPGKMLTFGNTMEIEGYSDEGEVMVVASPKPGEYSYVITPATDVKGTITKGIRVLVRYTEAGGVKTAISIEKVWGK